jgi:hypothetical protein
MTSQEFNSVTTIELRHNNIIASLQFNTSQEFNRVTKIMLTCRR